MLCFFEDQVAGAHSCHCLGGGGGGGEKNSGVRLGNCWPCIELGEQVHREVDLQNGTDNSKLQGRMVVFAYISEAYYYSTISVITLLILCYYSSIQCVQGKQFTSSAISSPSADASQ